MEGAFGLFQMISLYAENAMQFALGALTVLCVVLIVALMWVARKVLPQLREVSVNLDQVWKELSKLPAPVQNIIHLGLKDGQVTSGIAPVGLSIRPEDFKVNVERLYANMLKTLQEEPGYDRDPPTAAFCVIKHSGLRDMLDHKSAGEAEKALTRLLVNGDDEVVKRFLRTLADSVNGVTLESEAAIH